MAAGYVCSDYAIYQWKDNPNVICKIKENKTGKPRTSILEFSDGDEFTKVMLHQAM